MKLKIVLGIALLMGLTACQKPTSSFNQSIIDAHKSDTFFRHHAISFDINLRFNGKQRLKGRMTLLTNSSKAKIVYDDEKQIIVDGSKVWASPDLEQKPSRIRFDAYTWSYFFLFPYKLNDPGTQWTPSPNAKLDKREYTTQKLGFESGTGDAPDDWYIVFQNKETQMLEAAAYIVTANKTLIEAEEDPHAIRYENYVEIEGVPLSTSWTFWEWRTNKGLTKQLGQGDITNLEFVEVGDDFFDIPTGFYEVIN